MTINLATVVLIGMPGIPEMLVIGGVLVLLFGATKIPKLGKGLGEGIRNFKSGLKGTGHDPSDDEDTEDSNKAIVASEDPEKDAEKDEKSS